MCNNCTKYFIFFKKINLFTYLFLAALVFVAAHGLSLVVVHGLLIAVASLAAEHRL